MEDTGRMDDEGRAVFEKVDLMEKFFVLYCIAKTQMTLFHHPCDYYQLLSKAYLSNALVVYTHSLPARNPTPLILNLHD